MASSYTLNFSDPSKTNTISVTGPVRNTFDTSLDLVGPGYVAYGQAIHQNFVKLLENFASPNPPASSIEGQLWYDTSNPSRKILRVNNGALTSARWPSANGIYQQANDPSIQYSQNLIDGDMWVDTGNTQLKIRYGNEWTLVGPNVSTGDTKTGSESVSLISNTGDTYPVILNWINGQVVEIISYNSFTPRTVISGFSSLSPGINLTTKVSAKYSGLADRASALEISNGVVILASEILKNRIPTSSRQTHYGSFVVESPIGLFVKRTNGKEIQIYTTSSGAIFNYGSADSTLKIGVNNNSYIKFDGSKKTAYINTSTPFISETTVRTLVSYGSAIVKDNLRIVASTSATVGLTLTGSASVSGNTILTGNLNVYGLSEISTGSSVTVGNIIPANLTRSIGTSSKPFENIYVANIGSSGTYVRIYGSVTTATTLETARKLSITGVVRANLDAGQGLFDGTRSVTFTATAHRSLISDLVSTSTTTATQSLMVLDIINTSTTLKSISKPNFLADIYPGIMQTGMIVPSGTSTQAGYLLCNGFPQTQGGTYTNLFQVIGTRYGAGSAGTFRVPNLMDVTTSNTGSVVASIFYLIKT
jgi:hypothetical protein